MANTDLIIAHFAQQLDAWEEEYAGRPKEELTRLWLLALEREHLVTVAYRADVIEPRLAGMPISEPIRRAVARAIRWAWRDEEMHALFIRGALLREGTLPEQARAWLTQLEGRVAGWTASRQAHHRWHERPVTRLVAELLEVAGYAAGRIPEEVRSELHYSAFADWCRFNVAAERTAGMGWSRMAEVGLAAGASGDDVAAFERMAEDERRHSQIFQLFADSFDTDDALHATLSEDWLLEELGKVGQRFLSEPRPGDLAWRNPLGKGGVVVVEEGATHDTLAHSLDALLQTLGLPARLSEPNSKRTMRVAIKTTFMLVTRREDLSPAVSPALIRALATWLIERGCEVSVIDSRNVYDRFHRNRTVADVAGYLGLAGQGFAVVDAQLDQRSHDFVRGFGQQTVCSTWADADMRIVLGKLRGHPTSIAMLSLAALEGLGGRHDDYVFGDRKAERETAAMMLADDFPPDVALLDAWSDVPDGLLGMMGQPHPKQPMRLYGSFDAVAMDLVVARHLGIEPLPDVMTVKGALDWFGDPRGETVMRGPDTQIVGWTGPTDSARTVLLSRLALPVYTHASAKGALFVPQMDAAAFPEIVPASRALTAARAVVRAITEPEVIVPGPDELLAVTWERHGGSLMRVARTGQGPPLLLLHGYPETLQIWCRVAPVLARTHQVIAIDWPGQGYSEQLGDDAGPGAMSKMILALLDAWDIDKISIVAQDMGAQPALLFAAAHPERIARIVVMNSLLFADGPTSAEIAIMRRSGLRRAAFMWTPGLVYLQCKRTFLPSGSQWPEALEADFRGAFRRPHVRSWLSQMCQSYEVELPQLPTHYWRIKAPLLALWAEHDHHFPMQHGERLVGLLPNARLEVVPDGTHWMSWSRSEWVARSITNFLEDV